MDAQVEPPLRVEFSYGPGVRQVALGGTEALDRSVRAMNDAMGIIRQMAGRVRQTVRTMPGRPSEVEVAFGIKFDGEAGAVIAKAGVEASINVVFRWDGHTLAEAEAPLELAVVAVPPQPTP
ncbi:CU044_2847 family protein [Dactylosporangium sp. CS-033363]|uniref:CU044_2847 family protein n=1 Tax=Dactylosporangium sp. CS-033363 TaxID=3239935 RepID=UPI003D8A0059